ncbi:PREDICTED: ER membrane protein complex subunit 4 [Bactrocera latifrons]|uniref:ER membrane protein complex subunit 4 n=1 Tax=Bactrocera latifrons TaxID=174628 RepID=A0A0K8W7S6_BACLA|nr:PREDICTED: ER membrane protein complex subunit 4 [Bactrocera latifrons]
MSSKQTAKKYKWALDFNNIKNGDLSSPPGYNPTVLVNHTEVVRDQRLVIKKSWDLALGPLKQIPMNLFIMYMSGSSISIFPIMMVGMMLIRPLKAMFSTSVTSKMAEGAQGSGQKLIYFLGNMANVAVALYKCHSMGLLPTHASDWLAFVEPQTRLEYYGGGVSFI